MPKSNGRRQAHSRARLCSVSTLALLKRRVGLRAGPSAAARTRYSSPPRVRRTVDTRFLRCSRLCFTCFETNTP